MQARHRPDSKRNRISNQSSAIATVHNPNLRVRLVDVLPKITVLAAVRIRVEQYSSAEKTGRAQYRNSVDRLRSLRCQMRYAACHPPEGQIHDNYHSHAVELYLDGGPLQSSHGEITESAIASSASSSVGSLFRGREHHSCSVFSEDKNAKDASYFGKF